ncbi:hypothetical protein RUM44_010208 [Polyplax serrata]|uniref:Uncharacterized protein n=1 Tax=Polyplax serrata TaxID=468196 RepID=A0ABR1AUX3_POLSC
MEALNQLFPLDESTRGEEGVSEKFGCNDGKEGKFPAVGSGAILQISCLFQVGKMKDGVWEERNCDVTATHTQPDTDIRQRQRQSGALQIVTATYTKRCRDNGKTFLEMADNTITGMKRQESDDEMVAKEVRPVT